MAAVGASKVEVRNRSICAKGKQKRPFRACGETVGAEPFRNFETNVLEFLTFGLLDVWTFGPWNMESLECLGLGIWGVFSTL